MPVSNTTPIVYLVKIKKLNLLEHVYRRVYICSAVWQDIIHLQTRSLLNPDEIFSISQARQKWMVLRDPKEKESIELKDSLIDRGLGLGEAFLKIVDIVLGESRVATNIGSPYVPQSKEYFTITEKGIEDVQRQNS